MIFNRRQFLALTAAAAAQKRPAEPGSYYGGLRAGLNTGCYARTRIAEVLARVREFGLKYIEPAAAHADLLKMNTSEVRELRRRILDAGLSVHSAGPLPLARGDRGKLDDLCERAQEFAVRTLIVEADSALHRRLGERAEAAKINIALHGTVSVAEKAPARLGIALDSSVPDAAAEAARLRQRLFAVHLRPGADAAPLVAALRAAMYDGIVALDYDDGGDVDAAIRAGLEALKKITGGR